MRRARASIALVASALATAVGQEVAQCAALWREQLQQLETLCSDCSELRGWLRDG